MMGCAKRQTETPPSPQPSPAAGRGGKVDVHVFDVARSGRGKRFYLLDEGKNRLVSQPVAKKMDETEQAINFLIFVWDEEPPQILVMDGAPLGKNRKFQEFLRSRGVALSVLHPAFTIQRGKIERAIWRQEHEEQCPCNGEGFVSQG